MSMITIHNLKLQLKICIFINSDIFIHYLKKP